MSPRRSILVGYFLAYVVIVGAAVWGICAARAAIVAQFGTPEARRDWQAWKAETERLSRAHPALERRPVTSDEPPSLVLMRDHFGTILAGGVTIVSFVVAFLLLALDGSFKSRRNPTAPLDGRVRLTNAGGRRRPHPN